MDNPAWHGTPDRGTENGNPGGEGASRGGIPVEKGGFGEGGGVWESGDNMYRFQVGT